MAKKVSFSDRLRVAASKPITKGGDKPTLIGNEALVDKVIKMKNTLEDMKNQYDQLEGELLNKTFEVYNEARKEKNYSSSIFIPGKDTNGAMAVYSDKFSNLPIEVEKELRKEDPDYDKHFIEVRKLTVKRDSGKTISDKTLELIIEAFDKAGLKFEDYLDAKVEIGTQKGFAEMWEDIPKSVKEMVKQSKASVRNVTEDGKVC